MGPRILHNNVDNIEHNMPMQEEQLVYRGDRKKGHRPAIMETTAANSQGRNSAVGNRRWN